MNFSIYIKVSISSSSCVKCDNNRIYTGAKVGTVPVDTVIQIHGSEVKSVVLEIYVSVCIDR
jgi:hypothetical protein